MAANIFTDKIPLIVTAVIAGILLLQVICRLYKKRARNRELRQLAQDRQREEKLDAVLCNPRAADASLNLGSVPYEVDYTKGGADKVNAGEGTQEQIMVQLTEHNELSRRKHILSLDRGIRIGSSPEGNSIVVPGTAPCQCEIFLHKGEAYLKEVGEGQLTVLQRKKEKVYAEKKGIRLCTGDRILLGKICFDITIIRS